MSRLQSLQTLGPREVAGVIAPEALARFELFDFLETKGVHPFTDESVDEHQRKKEDAHERISDIFDFFTVFQNPKYLVVAIGCSAVVGVIIGGLVGGFNFGIAYAVLGGLLGGLVFALVTFLAILAGHHVWRTHVGSYWEFVSLADHLAGKRKVPKRVLALAQNITAARPDLMVWVERFADDPFLTIAVREMPNVRFRVAFWGEFGYRINRIKQV